jgi:cobalt-zinc-cadmium efflux system outer membrane protein
MTSLSLAGSSGCRSLPLTAVVLAALAGPATAQEPVTLHAAVEAALTAGARAAIARSDSAAAAANLRIARQFANPVGNFTYSKSLPQYHATLDLPLDYPWTRSARIAAAAEGNEAARWRLVFELAAIRFDVETTYVRALALDSRRRLSRRTASAADSLLGMARVRREAGDASDLEVELASINAGQLANAALDDSLAHVGVLVDLQFLMGLPAEQVTISLADSLVVPVDSLGAGGRPVTVAAAEANLRAQERGVSLEHRSVFGAPALTGGVEWHDPTGAEPGALPTLGIALPLPLFNRRGGDIALAEAARQRATAELAQVRRETAAAVARLRRERELALQRVTRGRALLDAADRVATKSLQAYAEGAVALPGVLEAQRNAREILSQYIQDLATATAVSAELRFATTPAVEQKP